MEEEKYKAEKLLMDYEYEYVVKILETKIMMCICDLDPLIEYWKDVLTEAEYQHLNK